MVISCKCLIGSVALWSTSFSLAARFALGYWPAPRVISSVVERFVHIEDVGSSNLSSPTIEPLCNKLATRRRFLRNGERVFVRRRTFGLTLASRAKKLDRTKAHCGRKYPCKGHCFQAKGRSRRVISSVGRALRLHRRCREFEPLITHHASREMLALRQKKSRPMTRQVALRLHRERRVLT